MCLSTLCLPDFLVQQRLRLNGEAGRVEVVYTNDIVLSRQLVPQSSSVECLHLGLSDKDRLGLLLVCQLPHCSTVFLPKLSELVLDVAFESPRLVILGDFRVRAKAAQDIYSFIYLRDLITRLSL